MAVRSHRTIVLIYPRAEPDWPDHRKLQGLPLAVLTVARSLIAAGFEVRVIDQNVTPRVMDELRAMDDAPLWVGFSVIGGHTLREAMRLARRVRRLWPGTPLVWGGWNPTLLPHLYEDAGAADIVDVVVRGRGERQAVEIARRVEDGASLEGIAGVSWRGPDGIVREPDAPLEDPSHAAPLPYRLVEDRSKYITRFGLMNFISSYGCPHRCGFCGIPSYARTFRPMDNEIVLERLREIAREGLGSVVFLDDNFFTQKERVIDLADRLVAADLGLTWYSNGRVDQVLAFSEEELRHLMASGCRTINIGYETGSQEVADAVQKDIAVRDIYELADRFRNVGLRLSLNFIVGLPDETPDTLVESLESLKAIYAHQPDLELCWYMFMPAPGTTLWTRLVEEGRFTEPRTLREHLRFQSLYLEEPWFYQSPPRDVFREWRNKLKAIAWYFHMAYEAEPPPGRIRAWMHLRLKNWCRRRYEARRFRLRADWLVFYLAFQLRVRIRWFRAWLSRLWLPHALARRFGPLIGEREPETPFVLITGAHRGT